MSFLDESIIKGCGWRTDQITSHLQDQSDVIKLVGVQHVCHWGTWSLLSHTEGE